MNHAMREALDRILLGVESERRLPRIPNCLVCEDTGWELVDDGLEDGQRLRQATSRRCACSANRAVSVAPERRSFR